MKFGIVTFVTDTSIRSDVLAKAVENHGFESLFVCEHSNIPASRDTPYRLGGDLPPEFYSTLDPFLALTMAASATRTLLLGTGVCVLVQRDPIHTAKTVATLDVLSGGRFQFGVGAGWNREEMAQHGTDARTRMRLLRERVLAIKALWGNDVAEYHGEFVDIAPTTVRPRPLQSPHPPIIVGGLGPTVLDRVLEYGDAWGPNAGWPLPPDFPDRVSELRERASAVGRGPFPVQIHGGLPRPSDVEQAESLAVDVCVVHLPTLPEAEALAVLATTATAIGL